MYVSDFYPFNNFLAQLINKFSSQSVNLLICLPMLGYPNPMIWSTWLLGLLSVLENSVDDGRVFVAGRRLKLFKETRK